MGNSNYRDALPLSYIYRDFEIARKLSAAVQKVMRETVAMEALEIASYIKKRILVFKPELESFLEAMEASTRRKLGSNDEKFRYEELVQISLIAKSLDDRLLRRFLCAYKMLLSVSGPERHFVDGIMIYYSGVLEQYLASDEFTRDRAFETLEMAIDNIVYNLHSRDEEYRKTRREFPPFLYSPRRELESDYVKKLRARLDELLEKKGRAIRRHIRNERNREIPCHVVPDTYGYKFRKCLYSNHSVVLKEPTKEIQSHDEMAQKGYSLFISYMIMKAFEDYPELQESMKNSLDLLEEHLNGGTTKREVVKSLYRLATLADDTKDDSICYQTESFINAMESILGKQVSSRAIRTDLSASLEANYHIQSPRKTEEIINYHLDSINYMDEVMKNYDDLTELMSDMKKGVYKVSEEEAPYRPDIMETDMDHLMSGAENVGKAYEKYCRNTRSPLPLDDKLRKDSIDERLERNDDIRYEIYSIVPDEEDTMLFRSMNFDIRDIF